MERDRQQWLSAPPPDHLWGTASNSSVADQVQQVQQGWPPYGAQQQPRTQDPPLPEGRPPLPPDEEAPPLPPEPAPGPPLPPEAAQAPPVPGSCPASAVPGHQHWPVAHWAQVAQQPAAVPAPADASSSWHQHWAQWQQHPVPAFNQPVPQQQLAQQPGLRPTLPTQQPAPPVQLSPAQLAQQQHLHMQQQQQQQLHVHHHQQLQRMHHLQQQQHLQLHLQQQQMQLQQQQQWGSFPPAAAAGPGAQAGLPQPVHGGQEPVPLPERQQGLPRLGMHAAQPANRPAAPVPASPEALQELAPAPQPISPAAPPATDARDLFFPPGRGRRPQRLLIILRGLPGSGKSHFARAIRDAELRAGAEAPRIHALDDYFQVEREVEVEGEAASGKKGGRKRVREMAYLFEPELEGAYRASLAKALARTLADKRFRLVVADAPFPAVADVKEMWGAAQRAGYEVYVLQPLESDPEVCFKRNIHERSLDDIRAMAAQFEATPSYFNHLDGRQMLAGEPSSEVKEAIQEVQMDDDASTPGQEAPSSAPRRSKWASGAAAEDGAGSSPPTAPAERPRKRAASEADATKSAGAVLDGLTSGLDTLLDGAASAARPALSGNGRSSSSRHSKGVLLRGGSGVRKSVRWADEAAPSAARGFSIGGASAQQLTTVYVLEGLGPPKEHAHAAGSFAAQVKAEHQTEAKSFLSLLLGHRPASTS